MKLWTLIYINGGIKKKIAEGKPYSLCKHIQKVEQANTKTGTFKIIYHSTI